ncbi:hypothetical protein EI067_15435 [Mycobacterium paragordonae]|uniref:DUF6308 family protein n=1 Tax=Mycobacterium paragordonae TaxID=1389713 RepID=UPI00105F494A|nr:DUF6308 family protein [Mycobacterium paragordonae]TDK96491.1 hypothetical protein EI067_15435 [Mycobacterium paragordonae]
MTTEPGIEIAGRALSIDDCVDKLRRYPRRTLSRYDQPGSGARDCLAREEIIRTRAVSSRISEAEVDWFLHRAKDAPWPSPQADDLRQADPAIANGRYDELVKLYSHFNDGAPRGIAMAKISKVLHVKRPAAYPILDRRIALVYRDAAAQAARRYPQRSQSRAYWAAIRDDLIANTESGALQALRAALEDVSFGNNVTSVTDLRLLDMLTWR